MIKLIEIYTEEMPARYVPAILNFAKKFFRKGFGCKVDVLGTCRRLVIEIEGEVSSERVGPLLEEFVRTAPMPKRMRWDESGLRFARPIRGLLVLSDKGPVENIELGKIKSGGFTFYLDGKTMLREKREVKSLEDYLSFLSSISVELSPSKRKALILEALKEIGKEKGVRVNLEEDLLEEVVFLVESPYVFAGEFDARFLELPPEVLVTSMARNQKLFTFSMPDGHISNIFAGVLEGQDRRGFDYSQVLSRVKSVLSARLSDALFFWDEDIRIPLTERAKSLKRVILHKDIGSVWDKVENVRALAERVVEELRLDERQREWLFTAISVYKADLETLMVYEFPELQGVMGYYYALAQAYPEAVALAIKEHYHPINFEDRLPLGRISWVLSVLDRVVDITAYFKAGLRPTGNEDLFGVRRMVLTLMKLVLEGDFSLNLDRLFSESIKLWKCSEEVKEEIKDYFKDRFLNFLQSRSIRRDIAEAVWRKWGLDLQSGLEVARALNKMAKAEEFQKTVKVLERTYKITKKVDKDSLPEVDPSLFEFKEERDLFSAYNNVKARFLSEVARRSWQSAVKVYSELYEVLHNFFDKVMVNVKDESVRANRLALLWRINELFAENLARFF